MNTRFALWPVNVRSLVHNTWKETPSGHLVSSDGPCRRKSGDFRQRNAFHREKKRALKGATPWSAGQVRTSHRINHSVVQPSDIVSCHCAVELWDNKHLFIHSHRINESTVFDSPNRRSDRGKRPPLVKNTSPNKARDLYADPFWFPSGPTNRHTFHNTHGTTCRQSYRIYTVFRHALARHVQQDVVNRHSPESRQHGTKQGRMPPITSTCSRERMLYCGSPPTSG
jgi:hypothetical protein